MRCLTDSSQQSHSRCSTGLSGAPRKAWWPWTPTATVMLFVVLALASMSGCASRTVFVPEESPMRVGPMTMMFVYHRVNGEWILSRNKIAIPEGWYLVPPSFVSNEPRK